MAAGRKLQTKMFLLGNLTDVMRQRVINQIIREDVERIIEQLDIEKCRDKTFFISGATGAVLYIRFWN